MSLFVKHMVKEMTKLNLFKALSERIASLGLSYKSIIIPLFLLLLIPITFLLGQSFLNTRQNAEITANSFLATFDGTPTSPQNFTQLNQSTWDVQVHSRDVATLYELESQEALHGSDCAAPPATHENHLYEGSVFNCKNHLMTAIKAGGYGAIYLTPNRIADFSTGEVVITFDISTWRSSQRDWWDVWITPYDQNMALPLESDLPDLNGPPKNAIQFRANNGIICPVVYKNYEGILPGVFEPGNQCNWATKDTDEGLIMSQTVRTPYEIRISKNHIKVGIPSLNLWWYDAPIPDLDWSQGVVQFGHHSYNPDKDCNVANQPGPDGQCLANTWHWDNIAISPSIPFTIIKADKRYLNNSTESITFSSPAPAGSMLRFAGTGVIDVSFDNGASFQPAQKQPTSVNYLDHQSSYWTPIPAGASTVKLRFRGMDWFSGPFIAKDFAIWSLDQSPITPTPSGDPTSTPIPTIPTLPTITTLPSPTPFIPYTVASNIINGVTISGLVAWIGTPSSISNTTKVDFLIDGVLKITEFSSPYQYNGDPNGVLDTKVLANGTHTLTIIATGLTGVATTTSTVTVSNTLPTPIPSPTPTKIPVPTLTTIPTATPTPINIPIPIPIPTSIGGVPGLTATYYNDMNFTSFASSRVDSTINFNWGDFAPNTAMGVDTFSALWTGQLIVPKANTYKIYTRSDDGVRVWIDGKLIINNWTDHASTENRATLSLTPGYHAIQVEFYENSGQAVMRLLWSSPSISKQVISSTYLRTK